MLFYHLILCRPLLLLPSIFPSIRVFSSELALCITWPKYWSFNFSNSPSNEYSGLLSLRIDWLGLLAVQGTLKSSPAHNSKTSILRRSAFMLQLSHLYMTTGKTTGLTIWIFVGKVMSTFIRENGSYQIEIPSACSLRQRLPSAHQVLIFLSNKVFLD
ncbi:unnamed protein product [Rangifer tarandus platyrhynchus]|uniref:Cytochrome c biogenesis B n=1 Tax=Rangifer tarandus platyrhynchus TaxID=3082113 RepID=A0ABN8ZKX4_RANTA|nr:unnamed protein product [Rangifer tarandus platyrhynchus]